MMTNNLKSLRLVCTIVCMVTLGLYYTTPRSHQPPKFKTQAVTRITNPQPILTITKGVSIEKPKRYE